MAEKQAAAVKPGTRAAACAAAVGVALAALGGVQAAAPWLQPLAAPSETPSPPWRVVGLPRQSKPYTTFRIVDLDGARVLRVEADASYGNLVHPLRLSDVRPHLAWRWRVDEFVDGADLRTRSGDDTALKVCVFFDLPLERVPFVERQILRVARAHSGEDLPAATVCYVWDAQLPVGTRLDNAYTRRMRYIVLESGRDSLHRWLSERRDVAADFLSVFGSESSDVPAVTGVALGADADNRKGHSLAHVADLVLEP